MTTAITPSWHYIRAIRVRLLTESDWTQLPDAPLSVEQVAAWAAYRAQLRDITETTDDPSLVQWPASPTV